MGLGSDDLNLGIVKFLLGFIQFGLTFCLLFLQLLFTFGDLLPVFCQQGFLQVILLIKGKDSDLISLFLNEVMIFVIIALKIHGFGNGKVDGRIVFRLEVVIGDVDDQVQFQVLKITGALDLGHVTWCLGHADDLIFSIYQFFAQILIIKVL